MKSYKVITAVFIIILSILLTTLCAGAQEDFFREKNYIPDMDTFMNIGYTGIKCISPDGGNIYISNNLTSTRQLFRITENEGYPYQLTFEEHGANYPSISPDGKWIVYLTDQGGNEQFQLRLMDAQTGRVEALTSDPEVRYGVPIWSPDGGKIYFRANRENPRDFSVYEMNLESREIRLVWGDPGYLGPSVVSADGTFLICYEYVTNTDTNLYKIDLQQGAKKLLTPDSDEILNIALTTSPDNKTLYFICNNNEEGVSKLNAMDLETGESRIIFDGDSPWGVEDGAVNPRRDKLALITNENGYGVLHIMDLTSGKMLPAPEIKGIVSSVFLADGTKAVFSANTATKPEDVFIWDWEKKEQKQLTKSSLAGIDADIFIEPELIKYRSFDGLSIPAFVYLPPDYKENMGNIPFIIDFHGGPEGQSRPYFQRHFNYLLLNGFGIMTPNIRGSKGYGKKYMSLDDYRKRMDSVKDGYHAALYLIKKGYTRKGKVGVKGGSYGGFMVMALITEYPDMWGAAFQSVGIVDFVNFLKNTKPYRRKLREAEYGPLADEEFLKSISPIHKIDRIKTPLMISHGENDPRVPVSEAYLIIDNLKERDVDVHALIWEDEGHSVSKKENRLKLYREMADFFKKHLK